MRTMNEALAAHLAGGETTLARCWRVRRNDGVVLGFTDHDRSLTVDGTLCSPAYGLDRGEVPARLGTQVETGEVLGVLDDEAIAEDDILLGRYDGAAVESWVVNWRAPEQAMLVRVDSIGEIVREDGMFRAELRSPQQALNMVRGRLYQGLCDATLGDARCGIDLDVPARKGVATLVRVLDPFRLEVQGLAGFDEGFFGFGMGLWQSGRRDGLRDAVLTHRRMPEGDILGFAAPLGEWVAEGDVLAVKAGCDRRFSTCKARFANAANFRGFPHVPGNDYLLRHPRRGDAMDGRAVVP